MIKRLLITLLIAVFIFFGIKLRVKNSCCKETQKIVTVEGVDYVETTASNGKKVLIQK